MVPVTCDCTARRAVCAAAAPCPPPFPHSSCLSLPPPSRQTFWQRSTPARGHRCTAASRPLWGSSRCLSPLPASRGALPALRGAPPAVKRPSPPAAGLPPHATGSPRRWDRLSACPGAPPVFWRPYPCAAGLPPHATGSRRRWGRFSARRGALPACRGAPPAVGRLSPSAAGLPPYATGSCRRWGRLSGHGGALPVCRGAPPARHGFPPPLGSAFRPPRGSPRLPLGSPGLRTPLLSRYGALTVVGHQFPPAAGRRWRSTAGYLRFFTAPLPSLYVLNFLLSFLSHRTLYRPRAACRHSCCSGHHCLVVHHVITSNSHSPHSCTAAAE